MITDADAWIACHREDRWLFDKLLLSTHLGYLCGPCGVPVPASQYYIVRPIMNLSGMGAGAELLFLEAGHIVKPGYFWCEVFAGRHISVDYIDFKPTRCVEGIREPGAPLYRWREWRELSEDPLPFPDVPIRGDYRRLNVEFIGGYAIEIHLRGNSDAATGKVCWEKDGTKNNKNFISDPDDADGFLPEKRLGFIKGLA